MTIDADGNISLNFTTYNGTSVTATAKYDSSPAATGVEDVQEFRGSESVKRWAVVNREARSVVYDIRR
jgi:hypothetical protein